MRPPILFGLLSGLDCMRGIGPKTESLLSRLCGKTVISVLFHLPSLTLDRTKPPYCIMRVTVVMHLVPKGRKVPYKILCQTDHGKSIELIFFNYRKDYMMRQFPAGAVRYISGQVTNFGAHNQMTHPDYITTERGEIPLIEPIYPLTHGVTNKMFRKTIATALKYVPAHLPEWSLHYNKVSFADALFDVHNPETSEDMSPLSPARMRLAYDELLANQLALALARQKMRKVAGHALAVDGKLADKLLARLPFTLTEAQKRVLMEIRSDMKSRWRMMRLLQGDVGSGKTIVSLLAMLDNVQSGRQACLMCPTDILSRQHYANISTLCKGLSINVILLTGREKGKTRATLLSQIADGLAHIIIGTHALFQEEVVFHNLGLVVIDEQHRFGVDQRLALTQKGHHTDVLVMTATPIPRSLALTYYGDMDCSQIDEKPKNRLPIDTRVLSHQKLPAIVAKIKQEIIAGAQIYWVCPLIEETEKSDMANVTNRFCSLQRIFGDKVGLLHGRMKGEEKDAVMRDFMAHKLDILVSTTVIEVGVDVPSATIMVVEQSERFGLAQLHQLRGRIGRGSDKSTCLLVYSLPLSLIAKKRLTIMKNSQDGFVIAEEDLKLRGAGEVLGTRQSGLQNFQLADMAVHTSLLPLARSEAAEILTSDPTLDTPRGKALRLLLYLFNKDAQIKTIHSG